jgi:trk system potassium uptake protein TrkA
MAQRCAVIGLGRFGTEVARWLAERNYPVLAIDKRRDLVEEISSEVDSALCFDSTNENALYDARINEMPVVVCAIGDNNIQNSILTTALLHQIGVPRIITRASSDLHARILKIVGATDVVNPEKDLGMRVAQIIANPGLTEVVPLAEGASVAEMNVPESFVGKTLLELRVRSRYDVNIIGVRRLQEPTGIAEEEEETGEEEKRIFLLTPKPDEPFCEGDILVVAGTEENVRKFSSLQ